MIEQLCQTLERCIESLTINSTFGRDRPVALRDRPDFIARHLAGYRAAAVEPFSLSLCNDEVAQKFASLSVWAPYVHLPDRAHTLIGIVLPEETPVDSVRATLREGGDVASAWHGTAHFIGEHVTHSAVCPPCRGLVPLSVEVGTGAVGRRANVPKHLVPVALQWMHYLSPESAELMGFPCGPSDQRWSPQSGRTPCGASMLVITRERMDLRREEHCVALRDAYDRFRDIWPTPPPPA